jgi:hypothetical protein
MGAWSPEYWFLDAKEGFSVVRSDQLLAARSVGWEKLNKKSRQVELSSDEPEESDQIGLEDHEQAYADGWGLRQPETHLLRPHTGGNEGVSRYWKKRQLVAENLDSGEPEDDY